MKPFLLILLFPFFGFGALAQEKIELKDTLLQNFSVLNDTQKVQTLLKLCNQFSQSEIKQSIGYGEQALKVAKSIHYNNGITQGLKYLSSAYMKSNNKQKALYMQIELLRVYKNIRDEAGQANASRMIGTTYEFLGDYPQALKYYLAALQIFEKQKDTVHTADGYNNIANVFLKEHKDSTALEYYIEALQLLGNQADKAYNNMTQLANDLGIYYKNNNKYEKAIYYFKKALSYANNIPGEYSSHAITMVLINMGEVFDNKNDFKQALYYNQQAFVLADKSKNKLLLGLSYENYARIFKSMDSLNRSNQYYEKAASVFIEMNLQSRLGMIYNSLSENYQQLNDFSLAHKYASMALDLSKKEDLPLTAENALKNLVTINKKIGQYKQALSFQKQLQNLKDTLLNKEKINEVSKLEILYETEKKQEEIKMLMLQKEKEITLRYLLLGSILFVIIIGAMAYRTQRIRLRKDRQIHASQKELMDERFKNIQIHEQQLQNEIDNKNKELTTNSLNFIQKNQLLEDLRNNIRDIRKNAGEQVANQLARLNHLISQSFNLDKGWDEFHLYFENVHDLFFKELSSRFPGLTNKDLRLCALLKLNLSSKEIATLTGISPSSVKMARYRLRKKLGLDSEEDLVAFFINLEKTVSKQDGAKAAENSNA